MYRLTLSLLAVASLIPRCQVETPQPGPNPPSGVGVRVLTVVEAADFPVAMAMAPDGRIFYTEKETGRIRILTADGQLLPDPFATVPPSTSSERGLLGIALHPDFVSNGWLYVYYTRSNTGAPDGGFFSAEDNRVVRFTAAGNVAGGAETVIFRLPALVGPVHNGGNIHFGPDRKLYVTIGELADPPAAQSVNNLRGKIMRINDDGGIPDDNPFGAGSPVFALGVRNSFDFTFDPVSQVLIATENGLHSNDEINRIVAGGNYGWPEVEGVRDTASELAFSPESGTLTDPIVDLIETVAPTGIDFAPDDTFGAGTKNQMFIGEYKTGQVMRYTLNADRTGVIAGPATALVNDLPGGITDIAFAADGTLYVTTTSKILHVVPE